MINHMQDLASARTAIEGWSGGEIPIPIEIIDLFFILSPLKLASIAMECEQSRLSDVIPLFNEVIQE